MDRCIVKPLLSVNDLPFGCDREKVRKTFGDFREFKKTIFSKRTTDDFGSFHVFYDENNCFEAIEIFNELDVEIDTKKVFPVDLNVILQLFEGFEKEGNSYINKELSIGITVEEEKMQAILFGNKGYYA